MEHSLKLRQNQGTQEHFQTIPCFFAGTRARGVGGGALARWARVTVHSLPGTACRRPSVMARGVTCLGGTAITQLFSLNKANELINKSRMYYLNAHRRKIPTGGRWKRAFTFSSAVCKKELKRPDRLFGVLCITGNTHRKDCQRLFFF